MTLDAPMQHKPQPHQTQPHVTQAPAAGWRGCNDELEELTFDPGRMAADLMEADDGETVPRCAESTRIVRDVTRDVRDISSMPGASLSPPTAAPAPAAPALAAPALAAPALAAAAPGAPVNPFS